MWQLTVEQWRVSIQDLINADLIDLIDFIIFNKWKKVAMKQKS